MLMWAFLFTYCLVCSDVSFLKLNIILRVRYSNCLSFSYLPVYLLNPEKNSFTSLVGSVKKYAGFFIYLPS